MLVGFFLCCSRTGPRPVRLILLGTQHLAQRPQLTGLSLKPTWAPQGRQNPRHSLC